MTVFGSYRNDQFANPDVFAQQIMMIMEQYEIAVIEYLTDPRNADCLQRRYRFPPTLEEIDSACRERAATLARLRQPQSRIVSRPYVAPDRSPGYRARVFVGQDVPQYAELEQLATAGELDPLDWRFGDLRGKAGLWVSLGVWESRHELRRSSTFRTLSDDELRAHYGRREAEAAKESAS